MYGMCVCRSTLYFVLALMWHNDQSLSICQVLLKAFKVFFIVIVADDAYFEPLTVLHIHMHTCFIYMNTIQSDS